MTLCLHAVTAHSHHTDVVTEGANTDVLVILFHSVVNAPVTTGVCYGWYCSTPYWMFCGTALDVKGMWFPSLLCVVVELLSSGSLILALKQQ